MYCSAMTPVPAPRETFLSVLALPFVSAKLVKIFKGSVPGKINSNGNYFLLSRKETDKLKVGG